ncbi:MAG: VanZ family protein [Nitrospirota bacterium]
MRSGSNIDKNINSREWKSWLCVFLCTIGIYSTIPLARGFQKFVYSTVGKEFFTYAAFFVVFAVLITLLYFFLFKLKIKYLSQYIWLFLCTGACLYLTVQLRKHPEETIHLLEYGFLSILIFKALSHRIRDWSIYISVTFLVLFLGTVDEFIQWMMPQRYWGLEDVKINTLAAIIFQVAIWKGIKPKIISGPVKKASVMVLLGAITLNMIFLGFCLSNTPDAIKSYTSISTKLSWLRNEEPMTEYAYKYSDPEIETFYSRMSLKEIREFDLNNGKAYGKEILNNTHPDKPLKELFAKYKPTSNVFLYEFLVHLQRRNNNIKDLSAIKDLSEKTEISNIVYRENLILEKYFKNILTHSEQGFSDDQLTEIQKAASLWKGAYISGAGGKLITAFSLNIVWLAIITIAGFVWISGLYWKRRLDD